jgi:Uma2 family endonuclease
MAAIPFQRDIDYPESDGRPLGETDRHRQEIVDLIYGLQQHYAGDPGVYVAGNMFLYYAQGNRSAVVCPDVFVVQGAGKELRRTFKVWEEGDRRPCLVIEVTSESTRDEDLIEKKSKYARLGVEEYFLFDPLGEYLSPPLQGFRLRGSRYFGIPLEEDGSLRSETTGLLLRREGGRSRLVNAATGEPLPRIDELAGLIQAAETRAAGAEIRAAAETAARKAAEEELARLRRQLAESRPAD